MCLGGRECLAAEDLLQYWVWEMKNKGGRVIKDHFEISGSISWL